MCLKQNFAYVLSNSMYDMTVLFELLTNIEIKGGNLNLIIKQQKPGYKL